MFSINLLEPNLYQSLFHFRVYRVSRCLEKRTVFDNIYDQLDCDLIVTAIKQDCMECLKVHDIVIRMKTEVFFIEI